MTALIDRYVATLERRTMGADSGPCSRGTPSRGTAGPHTRPSAGGPGSSLVEAEHRSPLAQAAAVLFQRQDGPSPLSAMVRTSRAAGDSQGPRQYAARRSNR